MVSKEVEEYLECLYRAKEKGQTIRGKDIAKSLKISQASVTEMLKKMGKAGFVKYVPYREVELTAKGANIGKKILRKHRFMERFLSYLGIEGKKAHNEACKLEHVVSDDVEKALSKKIKSGKWGETDIVPLTGVKKGKKVKVAFISGGRKVIMRLTDLGLTPGTAISVRKDSRGCPIEISVRGTSLCIGRGIAQKIFVEA